MTLDELEKLIKRAEDVTGCRINLSRDSGGKWNVSISGPPHNRDRYGIELGECVATLKKWATRPKPKTLTFTVSTDYCQVVQRVFNNTGTYRFDVGGEFGKALNEALAPYQQPE